VDTWDWSYQIKVSIHPVYYRPSVVLTGREAGVVDTWDWSYQIKVSIHPVYYRPSVVLTGREAGVVDTWDWSYQIKEPVASNKISNLPVTCIKVH
jgi:hypothetical protein